MKNKTMYLSFVILGLIGSTYCFSDTIKDQAINKVEYIRDSANFHNDSINVIIKVIKSAKGNIDNIVKCAYQIRDQGTNTNTILLLAIEVSKYKDDVPHFSELLNIVSCYKNHSDQVMQGIRQYLENKVSFEELKNSMKEYL
jgi:hypothetical protein